MLHWLHIVAQSQDLESYMLRQGHRPPMLEPGSGSGQPRHSSIPPLLGQWHWAISQTFLKSEFLGFSLSWWFWDPQKWVFLHDSPWGFSGKVLGYMAVENYSFSKTNPDQCFYSSKRLVCGNGQRTWKACNLIKTPKEGFPFVLHIFI